MGLLDGILGGAVTGDFGGTPEDEWKKAALEDLLSRIGAQPMNAAKGVPGATTISNTDAKSDPMPMPDQGAGRFAAPMLLGGPKAATETDLPALETREVKPVAAGGVPYTSPEAVVSPDKATRAPSRTVPVQRTANAPDTSPNLWDHLSALSRGYDKGGLVGGIADMMNVGRDKAVQNQTVNFLTEKLGDPGLAQLIARDPATLRAILPVIAGPKSAPTIIKIPGPYGQETSVVWNPKTGKLEPLSSLTGEQGQPQQLGTTATATAPAAKTTDATPAVPGGYVPAVPVVGEDQQPKPEQKAPATALPAGFRVGNAVPKPPEGYIHKAAPDGSGFLYDDKGQPVFESKAEADARAKGTEKRALERVDQEQQTQGVRDIITQARKVSGMPSFNQALFLGRTSLNLGLPTPWGTVGGDLAAPVKEVVRQVDPENPAWGTYDEINAIQQRLNLLVARPLMKGQGQVTEGERKMISDAIGGLAKASNSADFQFRLNSVERMIEAMNTGRQGAVTAASSAASRPSQSEIMGSFYDDPKYGLKFRPGAVEDLAKRYNVREADMQQYLNGIIMRGRK